MQERVYAGSTRRRKELVSEVVMGGVIARWYKLMLLININSEGSTR